MRKFSPALPLVYLLVLPFFADSAFPQGMVTGNRRAASARPLPPGKTIPEVRYEDIAAKAGLTGVNVFGPPKDPTYIVETTGNGLAVLDYNDDGLLDIFLVNGDRLDKGAKPVTHYLYRNDGNLQFTDVTAKSGLAHTGWGQGACAGDVDNDGHTDLLVTHWGQDVLFRNQGDSTFVNETEQRGLSRDQVRWSTGCAFFDFNRDGHLDLFVVHYVNFDMQNTPRPGESSQCHWKGDPVPCGPHGLPGETMSLYRNDGEGKFVDVSEKSGVAVEKIYYGFTPLTGDFDNDGWPDVYVACDSTASLLFRNKRDGTFEEIGLLSGTAYNDDGLEQAGMGAAAGDYDGDGLLDIVKTNFSNDTNTLYHNLGDWMFADETIRAGLAVDVQYVGWGTAFVDFDHDGWKDIFIANGHVYPNMDNTKSNETFKQPRLLYWNAGQGHFYEISSQAGPGIQARHSSRGIAAGDLDNDGSLELVVVNMHEPPSLLKNFGERGNALLIRALDSSGRDAIGAQVAVSAEGRSQVDEVRSGGYHISQSDFRVHFGLGEAAKADVSVRWVSGETDSVQGVAANQWLTIREGKGIVQARAHQSQQ